MVLTLLLLTQQPPPDRFSILVPTPPQDCRKRDAAGDDVVVCAPSTQLSQRLPLPDEVVPSGPVASNPHLSARTALAAEVAPCPARLGGCQVGFGAPIASAIVGGLVGLIKDATRTRPDKSKRVPIPLD
ncbi:hypothetical protein [uncultured Sphingomonas sp.]|uniref:hypothetical protein n=1 Tax=uncultured Sphingomonas sp. TaxID=158754 RepID=UPI0035CCA6DD